MLFLTNWDDVCDFVEIGLNNQCIELIKCLGSLKSSPRSGLFMVTWVWTELQALVSLILGRNIYCMLIISLMSGASIIYFASGVIGYFCKIICPG